MQNRKTILFILLLCAAGALLLSRSLLPAVLPSAPEPAVSNETSTEPALKSSPSAARPSVQNEPDAACNACGQLHPGRVCEMYGGQKLMTLTDLPDGTVKSAVARLLPEAQARALLQLSQMSFREQDEPSVRVDHGGAVYYVCNFGDPAMPEAEQEKAALEITDEPLNAPEIAAAVSINNPPVYHSRPGATRILFLDFNGHDVTGTAWNVNTDYAMPDTWYCYPYSIDSDYATFNDTELTVISQTWARVSEDYAPFDVDVTTEEPAAWTRYVGHALITRTNDANGVLCPHAGAGGLAYVGFFGTPEHASHSPAWVNNYTDSGYLAEVISHELGHNMGLHHDGTSKSPYYYGHGNGSLSWAPIMGAGYGKSVTQWSKGEYYDANQLEDDLTVISGKLPYRLDDYGGSIVQAAAIQTGGGLLAVTGNVERTGDADMFSFTCVGGTLVLTGSTYRCASGSWGGNGDLVLQLYNGTGTLLASNNPALETKAVITQQVAGGTYYVKISPTGTGTPLTNPPSGYTSYGSLGPYRLTGRVPLPDRDTDGIPDEWELQYFGGETNANPAAMASNKVNTVMETYIAGISPVNPQSLFSVTNAAAEPAGFVVRWNAVTGRVYGVDWTAGLSSVFQPLATNIVWPQAAYTDSVHGTQSEGFYRVRVQLVPSP